MAGRERDKTTSASVQGAGGSGSGSSSRGAKRRGRQRPSKRSGREGGELGDSLIAGVPARIMRPRLVFAVCLFAILAFGLLMVYSASSVEALSDYGSSTYYLVRQAVFVAVGLVAFAIICAKGIPWRLFRSNALWVLWGLVMLLLVLVLLVGTESGGATRWIDLGFVSMQPSEFAKPVVILLSAKIFSDYYEEESISTGAFLLEMVVVVGVAAALIVIEPDLGTTVILLATIFAMAYLAGVSYPLIIGVVAVLVVGVVVAIVAEPYRLTRFLVMLDPWSDPYGDGYQATLAIMAFASGGLFGRGIGNSTMKYNYLPEAYTDYILAVIGEEIGFVGTVIFFVVYLAMIFAAFRIAQQAPTLHQQLLASGCAFIILLQFFINALGILSVLPMTGKTMPFISYGGSSMVSSLILAGIIMRVSLESEVETEPARRRADLTVMSGGADGDLASSHPGTSTAGKPHKRSARNAGGSGGGDRGSGGGGYGDGGHSGGGFTVHDGGRGSSGYGDGGSGYGSSSYGGYGRGSDHGRGDGYNSSGYGGYSSDRGGYSYGSDFDGGSYGGRYRDGGYNRRSSYGYGSYGYGSGEDDGSPSSSSYNARRDRYDG